MTSAEKRAIAPILRFVAKSNPEGLGAVAQTILDRVQRQPRVALSARPAAKARKARKLTKRETKAATRDLVRERAGGRCEAHHLTIGGLRTARCFGAAIERDHFWGQGRDESVEGSWMLCIRCHRQKTDSVPDRASWLRSFGVHLYTLDRERYGPQIAKVHSALALERAQHPESRAANTVQPEPDREPTNAG